MTIEHMRRRLVPLLAVGLCLASLMPAGAVHVNRPVSGWSDRVGVGRPSSERPGPKPVGPVPEPDPISEPEPELPVYLTLPNGHPELLDRYLAWAGKHPEAGAEEAVFQVNMGLDRGFYEKIQPVADPNSLTVLVNKYYALPSDYVPALEELGTDYGFGSMRPEAARAFRAMVDAAGREGVTLRSVSAYRSYETQERVYNRYLGNDGQPSVDTYSARPGHSEHQTGLAVDINVASRRARFETTPAFDWLKKHCAEYGFILRYTGEKQSVTGFCFEPWHYRYVGVEAARACMSQGLAYEEYLALLPD